MSRLNVTVSQMSDDREKFEEEWVRLGAHVKKKMSDIVLLPEMPFFRWFYGVRKYDSAVWRQSMDAHRRWTKRLGELGAEIVLASSPVQAVGRRHNEGFVWTRGKGRRGIHFKSYLPNEPGYYEASWYSRGNGDFVPFDAGTCSAGFMICSELWAMGHARRYGKDGVQLLVVPRCTGKASVEKWMAGGKVASLISGAYCISSNRAGGEFGGVGWAIDPDGNLLASTSAAKPFVTVSIDLKKVESARRTYPRYALNPD
jgi:N-carbamoylputrescine amidase